MIQFPTYGIDDAPEKSRAALRGLQKAFGFVPNIAGAIAGSPTLIDAFVAVFTNAHSGTLTEPQIQVLLLTNAVTNACPWAVAFHTHLALAQGVASGDVDAIRAGSAPREPAHAALSNLTRGLIERRGHVDDGALQAFLAAGFEREQVLEVVLVLAASTITNHVGTLARPMLEETFRPHAWTNAES